MGEFTCFDTLAINGYSKSVLSGYWKRRLNWVFKIDYRLMQVKSILQYFQPSLSYHLSLRSLLYLFFECPLKTGFTVLLTQMGDLISLCSHVLTFWL